MKINEIAGCPDQYERNVHITWERKPNRVSKAKGTSPAPLDLVTMAEYLLITVPQQVRTEFLLRKQPLRCDAVKAPLERAW